jgi:hypothetical protein
MDTERITILTIAVCFCVMVAFTSGCQRDIETSAIKAGLHQDVGSGRWVK